jgi:hypothetical protein
MKAGDVAGLALLNFPYAWIGVRREADGAMVEQFDQTTGKTARVPLKGSRVWLRAHCDFLTEKARFSYSTDGKKFGPLGDEFTMIFQLKTFQGVRYSLFAYNGAGRTGGTADFDSIEVHEPYPRGLMRPIPYGRQVRLTSFRATSGLAARQNTLVSGVPTAFTVVDMKLGRVALKSGRAYVSVDRDGRTNLKTVSPGLEQSFQWIETPTGELVLMSLASNRYLRIGPRTQGTTADSPGPEPDGNDGTRFVWSLAPR